MTSTRSSSALRLHSRPFGAAATCALALTSISADAQQAPEIPAIQAIVVPDFIGVEPAQKSFETALGDHFAKIDGVRIAPARCGTDGGLITTNGMVLQDAAGVTVNTNAGEQYIIDKSGAGTANIGDAQFIVEADGSGTINRSGEGGGEQIIVDKDGSGTFNGPGQQIVLDGKGGGTWNSDHLGQIIIDGDGGGAWNSQLGQVLNHGDGSGSFNGAHSIINEGDGTGTIDGVDAAMEPLPPVPPAGKFPLLTKFRTPPAACGYIITFEDHILFDFDKSDLRPDAAKTVDALAAAFVKVAPKQLDVRGHTDAKGEAAYNQDLSERRATTIGQALKQRNVASVIETHGFGKTQPVAANEVNGKDNPAGRQLNRRVEIYVPNS